MQHVAWALSLLPNKQKDVERFCRELDGPRHKEFVASQKRLGIHKENWYYQARPEGDIAILYLEAENILKVLQDWIVSKEAMEIWEKEQIKGFTGNDWNKVTDAKPLSFMTLEYSE